MPQSRLIHETNGAQVGLEGCWKMAAVRSGTRVQQTGCMRKRAQSSCITESSSSHPSRFNDNEETRTLRFAAATSTFKILATSRQRCVGPSAPSRWRHSRASPFARLTTGIPNSGPDHLHASQGHRTLKPSTEDSIHLCGARRNIVAVVHHACCRLAHRQTFLPRFTWSPLHLELCSCLSHSDTRCNTFASQLYQSRRIAICFGALSRQISRLNQTVLRRSILYCALLFYLVLIQARRLFSCLFRSSPDASRWIDIVEDRSNHDPRNCRQPSDRG